MGTPEFAVPSLVALVAAGHDVVAAYTQPPRRAGRGKTLTPSPIQLRAEAMGIEVQHPVSLRNADEQAAFPALDADIGVVAAYGLILPQSILDAPKHGCINVHASLLPRWRGAAPIHRAILAGDKTTGVTIMQMEAGLDTGPMLATVETPISDVMTTGGLEYLLAQQGAALLVEVLGRLSTYPLIPQAADGITYASKIAKAEAQINFEVGAPQVIRQIRAFNPKPGAWFEHDGERIRIHEAVPLVASSDDYRFDFPSNPGMVLDDQLAIGCGNGVVRPTWVQRAGRSTMDVLEFLRGFPIAAGTQL